MILIADSGSSKTMWCVTGANKTEYCTTKGINPFFMDDDAIVNLLSKEFSLNYKQFEHIYFYGAGCTIEKKQVVHNALSRYFDASDMAVESDLLAAARALCQNNAGIACILGTGSNSCYYDGSDIIQSVSPLGYILGDEGSGAVMGKKLIADILKNQISDDIKLDFFNSYQLTQSEILESVYRKSFPNRFLSQFTKFIAKHIDKSEFDALVSNSFNEFIIRNILQYKQASQLTINFTGSIAFVFRKQLEKQISNNGLRMGCVSQNPMEGLIKYHTNL